jgi:hypothetical protein
MSLIGRGFILAEGDGTRGDSRVLPICIRDPQACTINARSHRA